MMYIYADKSNDMLSHVEILANEYTQIEITNIDQTNVRRWRAAYFFDKRLPRRNNQLLEIWFEPRNNRLVFVLFKSLLTEE